MDTVTGATLGVVCVRFRKVEEAKRCVDKEDGVPSGSGLNVNGLAASVAGEERRAVLDPEGLVRAQIVVHVAFDREYIDFPGTTLGLARFSAT